MTLVSLIEVVTKLRFYFAHERLWKSLSFGRIPEQKEYQI
ncbi:MAG: DUF2061 domain-containing protein [Deltaproteobacteria bacterium]|nr:DUF2061 domain-containing protein [Deltaproteobacteria bacterium]